MICKRIDLGDGNVAIVCYRGRRIPCSVPGCPNISTKECDHPILRKGVPGTCDMKLCDRHAKSIGPDRDLCPAHEKSPVPVSGTQPKLPGVK